jgi:hypothetical protein
MMERSARRREYAAHAAPRYSDWMNSVALMLVYVESNTIGKLAKNSAR